MPFSGANGRDDGIMIELLLPGNLRDRDLYAVVVEHIECGSPRVIRELSHRRTSKPKRGGFPVVIRFRCDRVIIRARPRERLRRN